MRVSLRWLQDYIDLPTTDRRELSRAFDMLGHAVEDVEEFTAGWTDVVVGRVIRIESHPNADAVRVTHVDLGDGDPRQIICGAWNFDEGAVVPVAVPGAILPGGFEIGTRTIRGVESHGMICSERELGLGDVHEGIMVLDPATPLGVPFESTLELPDVVFDLEITNNRPDVMGMIGVARELAAWFDIDYRTPDISLTTVPGAPATAVRVSAPDGCNRFVARELVDVEVGPSPLWMRERLRKAGVRAISNVVDVSNYVMMEMGHPLHAFDAARIAGDILEVRWAADGETLVTLDDVERKLVSDDLVIADAEGPTSLAAVMGGARSEVNDATTRVLMEAASWNPATVMYTSRRHDLRSEASSRFERGIDPNLAPVADDRACQLLAGISGAAILDDKIDVVVNPAEPWTVVLPIDEVQRILDDRFTAEWSAALLRRLNLEVATEGTSLQVTVPTYRRDLTRPADLIEELARLADYDTFAATLPTGPVGGLTSEQVRVRRVHDLLRGQGLSQAMNLPFVGPADLAAFGKVDATGDPGRVVSVRNPLRDDLAMMRQSLLPGLLKNLRDNRNRGSEQVGLFETARVFFAEPWHEDPRVPDQPLRLGVAIIGPFGTSHLGRRPEGADAGSAFAVVSALAAAMGIAVERRPASPPGLHPTRSAELVVDGDVIGVAGELHPAVAEQYELGDRVAVVELDLARLVALQPNAQMVEVSTFPHVDFDLSFEVPADLAAADLIGSTSAASPLVEWARVFDDYRHEDTGLRAVAIRYRLRAPDRTLSGDEVATERQKMIERAAELGATLRGGGN
jgi:phenylalanyl-tRNA synthetase beta chain